MLKCTRPFIHCARTEHLGEDVRPRWLAAAVSTLMQWLQTFPASSLRMLHSLFFITPHAIYYLSMPSLQTYLDLSVYSASTHA